VVGPRTIDQLGGALHATNIDLPQEILDQLDVIFPGPGPAPEAYAW
jgi:aryl-alcohol dehydrogenase-like predicted oxidoreductase